MKQCECIICRYYVFHVTPQGEIFAHSQGAWDYARLHGKTDFSVTVPITEYRHDLTREQAKAIYTKYA